MNFLKPGITDVIDIILVSIIFYKLYVLVKGTRAVQMFIGLALILVFSLFVNVFDLHALEFILGSLRTVWVIAIFVLFQPELRRALATLGENRIVASLLQVEPVEALDEIIKATYKLSDMRLGGLLVLEKDVGLKNIIQTGVRVTAAVSADLLTTIFVPQTPLHDGAVIIRSNQIVAAGCILPLTQNPVHDRALGTRHRAALGLSEESDAGIIIISEETQAVSFARRGQLLRELDRKTLEKEIISHFGIETAETPAEKKK